MKLKPCPFCGSTKLNKYKNRGTWYIKCESCFAISPTGIEGINEAINLWNTRKGEKKDV